MGKKALFTTLLLFLLLLVDKKEINQLHANFIRECPAGFLSRADLLSIYRLFFPFGDPEPFVLRLMEMFRGRGTGVGIGFEDYVQGMSVISRGRVDEKLKCKPRDLHEFSQSSFAL